MTQIVEKVSAKLCTPEGIRKLLKDQSGRFVTLEFVKKDGTIRKLNCQPATIAHRIVPDSEASESAKRGAETRRILHPNLIPVWDVQNAGKMLAAWKAEGKPVNMATLRAASARSVNTETLKAITARGVRLEFV